MNYFDVGQGPLRHFLCSLGHRFDQHVADWDVSAVCRAQDPLVFVFALFVSFWAILANIFWRRKNATQVHRWGVSSKILHNHVRPQFYGTSRISPVTNRCELYYPTWKRALKYCVSIPVLGLMLVASLLSIVASLNLQGLVNEDSALYFPILQGYFSPDDGFLLGLLPPIIHALVVTLTTKVFIRVAEKLTDWENYRTYAEWENQYAAKIFFITITNNYLILFHYAFIMRDAARLKAQLVILFSRAEVQHIFQEYFVPFIFTGLLIKGTTVRNSEFKDKKMSEAYIQHLLPAFKGTGALLHEAALQYGYMLLFAAAFPLASILTMIGNYFRIKASALLLLFGNRRAIPFKTTSIGIWRHIFLAIGVLCIFTNIGLCLITFETIPAASKPATAIIIFVAENIVLGFLLLCRTVVPRESNSVMTAKAKNQYLGAMAL
eukprot:CAMPEP_0168539834 /NCGR_PEP_ID=MMETSP0405-20121227/22084_1 /TAXON_ID=498012 /ORGANISM="Trichosphaerium sp, Strain Am-I-7 wt" /LENGTH=434 /DNA_ID=CAMNT_0008569513 /DNA_START=636 /DNA_END=1937 /DNA_ORIENTATION=+